MTGFFEETPGVKSMMRLMSFFVLIFFFAYDTVCLVKGQIPDFNYNLTLLVAAFFPKLLQKIIELKFPSLASSITTTTDVKVSADVQQKVQP